MTAQDKAEAIILIEEACDAGCRLKPACDLLALDIRTFQRWKKDGLEDKRRGPITVPGNKLTDTERSRILTTVNSPEYRDLPPCQIVPQLADQEIFIASESTMYRLLRAKKMLQHRSAARPRKHKKPKELRATKPNQIWSWDITYLNIEIRGKYFYLYLFVDIFSRKIVGYDVYDQQTAEDASRVVTEAYLAEGIAPGDITLHSDNGKPMKGNTMLATLERLEVARSFSRPSVSDDNPYSEALFKTLKYCPKYPSKPFGSVEAALTWVKEFVYWYNNVHRHSGINFVTPASRHENQDIEILKKRKMVYERAKLANPSRWSGATRNCERIDEVYLNKNGIAKKAA